MRAALAIVAVLVAAFVSGRALVGRSGAQTLQRLWPFADLFAGLCLVSWLAFLLVECGLFSLARLSALVLVVAAAARAAQPPAAPSVRLTPALLAAAGIASLAAALYLPPYDTSAMASDATYHFNVGVHVARVGGLGIADPLLTELDASSRALLFPEWLGGRIRLAGGLYLGSLDAATAWPTYSHLLSVWIAILEAAGGAGAGRLAGVVFVVLGVWAVFLLAAEARGTAAAILAALLLVTSQAEVFYGRFAMPEVVGQALFWGGAVAFVLWWRHEEPAAAFLAAAGLGLSGFARLELLAFVPLALALQLGLSTRRPRGTIAFGAVYLLLLTHAFAHLALFPSHYRGLLQGAELQWPLVLASGGGVGLAVVTLAVSRPPIRRIAVLALVAVMSVVYAHGAVFTGVTPLRWLAESVSWPILGLAAIGLVAWSREAMRTPAMRFPLFVFLVATAAFLYYAHVTAVQLWGIRRFLPITIPFVYVLAADAALRVAEALVPRRATVAAIALAVLLLLVNERPVRPLLGTGLFPSQTAALRALAEGVPPGGVVFVAPELTDFNLHVPLWLAHERETFVLSWWNWENELRRAAPQLLVRHPVFYLARSDRPEPTAPPLALSPRRDMELRFVVPDANADRAPRDARTWNVPLRLYEVGALAARH